MNLGLLHRYYKGGGGGGVTLGSCALKAPVSGSRRGVVQQQATLTKRWLPVTFTPPTPRLCESSALVRAARGATATLGTDEFGGYIFWWSTKTVIGGPVDPQQTHTMAHGVGVGPYHTVPYGSTPPPPPPKLAVQTGSTPHPCTVPPPPPGDHSSD